MDSFNTIQNLYDTDGLLDILLGVEEYFDNMDLYAYKNWINGEIVSGPTVSKYWVEIILKFEEGHYPDPVGSTILTKQGTKIFVKKDVEIKPIEHPRNESDMETISASAGMVNRPKNEEFEILLYKFQIPRRLVNPESFDEYRLMVSDFNSNPDDMNSEDEEVPADEPMPNEGGGEFDDIEFDEEI